MITPMQEKFLWEFINTNGNATQAAKRAGYSNPAANGSALLKKPEIKAELERLVKSNCIGVQMVLRELSEIATADIGEILFPYVDEWGKIDLLNFKKSGKTHLIKDFQFFMGKGYKISFHDKGKALDTLAKYHDVFKELDKSSNANKITVESVTVNMTAGKDEEVA